MKYKHTPLLQECQFEDIQQFLWDVEDTFKQIVQTDKPNKYATLHVIAPNGFIQDLVYYLIISPHIAPEITTRFSLFEEYTVETLSEYFSDDKNKNLMFSINEDRVCFIDDIDRLGCGAIDDEFVNESFYYLHEKSADGGYLTQLDSINAKTLLFSINGNS